MIQFRGSKKDDNFMAIKWLLKARAADDFKPIFTRVFIDDENVVCTDSTRLHMLVKKNSLFRDAEPGLYEVIKNTTTEIVLNLMDAEMAGEFPNYKRILPGDENLEVVVSRAVSAAHIGISRIVADLFSTCTNLLVNIRYLSDVFCNEGEAFQICAPTGWQDMDSILSPVVIRNETYKTAVIMPIQKKG